MRMSVYKKMGSAYLTRTKDLILACAMLAIGMREEVVSPIRSA